MAVEGYTSKNVDESLNTWDKIFDALPEDMKQEFMAFDKNEQEMLKMTIMSDMKQINKMSVEEAEEEFWKQALATMTPEEQKAFSELDEDEQEYHKICFLEELEEKIKKNENK